MTQELSYASLCTGYDGIGRALRLAGMPIVARFHAEVEPAVADLLKIDAPGVPNVGDIKTVPWHMAPHVDVLSSGDPCQSISVAGRQEGRNDPRFLWPWVRAAYQAVRPGAIFFENVANMSGHDGGRTMAERFEHLREDGYEVRWMILGACAVGAPHHRHRWYAVAAYRGPGKAAPAVRVGARAICGAPRSGGRLLLPTPKHSDHRGGPGTSRMERGEAPWHDLPTYVALLPTPAARDGDKRGTPSPEHAARRIADPARSTNLEDAIVARLLPTPLARDADRDNEGDAAYWERRGAVRLNGAPLGAVVGLLPTPTALPYGSNRGGSAGRGEDQRTRPSLDTLGKGDPELWGKYADAVALWEYVTGNPAPDPTEPNVAGTGRRLSRSLPEWMMGLRPGTLTDHMGRNEALKAAGNGVVVQAAAAAWNLLTAS